MGTDAQQMFAHGHSTPDALLARSHVFSAFTVIFALRHCCTAAVAAAVGGVSGTLGVTGCSAAVAAAAAAAVAVAAAAVAVVAVVAAGFSL